MCGLFDCFGRKTEEEKSLLSKENSSVNSDRSAQGSKVATPKANPLTAGDLAAAGRGRTSSVSSLGNNSFVGANGDEALTFD